MSPEQREVTAIAAAREQGCREAAALALLYPLGEVAHIVLTLRRPDLPDHAGQVSLPGGRCQPDEAAVACAIREAWEELAVPPDEVELLGALTPLYIAPSGHCVQPFVASLPQRPEFRPALGEVAEVIEVAMDELADPNHVQRETWELRGTARVVPFFAVGGHKVWGATAMMLAELCALWLPAATEPSMDADDG
jgi:8-oxo-dGTP pyrophosphatase MutT (NUDIX family)